MLDLKPAIEPVPTSPDALAPPGGNASVDAQPRRIADFATLGEALDYAARGRRGLNFHDARGTLVRTYPYAELRDDALAHARRFIALGIKPGDRVALIAETGAEFAACFLRRGLCRRVAGAAALADQLRRPRSLCRAAGGPADQQRPGAVPVSGRARRIRRRGRRRSSASRRATGKPWPTIEPAAGDAPDRRHRRHRLSAIFERLDPLPARRRGHPPGAARQSSRPRRRPGNARTPTAAFRGCPGITTWAWSAACCRRSPTRCRSII